MRSISCFLIVFSLLFGALGSAQEPLSPEAQEALHEGRQVVAQALATYDTHFLDKPLWKAALAYGQQARAASPTSPEVYRFLAEVYGRVTLFEQAWQAWLAYETYGGRIDAEASANLVELGTELGYTKYSAGQYRDAIGYYQTVVQQAPDNETVRVQLALSLVAVGEDGAALEHFEALAAAFPDNQNYRTYVNSTRDRLTYGKPASDAFYQGLSLYYTGQIDEAWLAFNRATRANPDYREAFVWAGRVALELAQPQDAIAYWRRAVELEPDDVASYFLKVAQNQARWGVDAYTAFEEGVNLYTDGAPLQARPKFQEATRYNPDYAEAWAWLGRVYFEANAYGEAFSAYERAYQLAPENSTYQYFYGETARLSGAQVDLPTTDSATPTSPPELPTPATEPPAEAGQPITLTPPPATTPPEVRTPTPPATPTEAAPPQPEPTQAEPAPARTAGPPLVLLDVTRTFGTSEGAESGAISFFKSPSNLLRDLRAPVDYAGGTLYQRVEVFEKPGDADVQLQFCLVPNDDIIVKPTCSDAETLRFTSSGAFEASQALESFAQYGNIDWERGVSNLMIIVKDENGDPIDPGYSQLNRAELEGYYPMAIRYTAVLVPAGSSFAGWP